MSGLLNYVARVAVGVMIFAALIVFQVNRVNQLPGEQREAQYLTGAAILVVLFGGTVLAIYMTGRRGIALRTHLEKKYPGSRMEAVKKDPSFVKGIKELVDSAAPLNHYLWILQIDRTGISFWNSDLVGASPVLSVAAERIVGVETANVQVGLNSSPAIQLRIQKNDAFVTLPLVVARAKRPFTSSMSINRQQTAALAKEISNLL